jgi:hypothetical protein
MGHFPKYYRFLLNHPVYSTQYEGWNTGQWLWNTQSSSCYQNQEKTPLRSHPIDLSPACHLQNSGKTPSNQTLQWCTAQDVDTDAPIWFQESALNHTAMSSAYIYHKQSIAWPTILLRRFLGRKPSIRQSLALGSPAQNTTNPTFKILQHPKILLTTQQPRGHIQQENLTPSPNALGRPPT